MKSYEELSGARGRAMFYRAERHRARDLFRRAVPDLQLNGAKHYLDDISLSGLGASVSPGANEVCRVGERVSVELGLGGTALFDGLGEVARVDPTPRGTKVGVRLVDRCFSVAQLAAKSEEILIRLGLREFLSAEASVDPDYRRLCADVIHLLRSYRTALERFEGTKPSPTSAAEMLAECEATILPRWRELWHVGNEIVAPKMADDAARRATKEFTELLLTPEFMRGAIWRRSYEKPLGYPGDFQIMDMVYDWRREGERLSDRLVHRLGLDVAECIATRMVMMREAIATTVLKPPHGSPARIAALGCGSAREVVDYLAVSVLPRPVELTLIDQDGAALSQVYERTYPEVLRLHRRATVSCLHTSFNQLLKTGELFGALPPLDLIYTVGLVDYLSERRARGLVASLYGQLARGGTLIVGNMLRTAKGNLWPMEFICDWSIAYRDEREMQMLAADLPDGTIDTCLDPTGRVCLLTVRKT